MKDWKSFCKKILYPPVWLMLLLVLLSAAALTVVFVKDWDESPLAYGTYVLAFYSLTVVCLSAYTVFPARYRKIKNQIYANKFGNRYLTDVAFKAHVSLFVSLILNLLYAGINGLSFFLYRSIWFATLAGYYIILAVMRYLLVRYVGKVKIGSDLVAELRRSRLCAMILMMLNLASSGSVLMILYQNKGYVYNGILIYVMAMYTFYVTTHAIVDMIKYRKYNSPVLSTAKVITLSAALVSMLNLETAMFSQFGAEMPQADQCLMIIATGAGVSAVVVSLSIYLIVRSTQRIRVYKTSSP